MSLEVTRQWLQENTNRRFEKPTEVYELVDAAITQHRSLKPKIAEYVSEDKAIQALLCLHGTLPVVFNGATFNIPVVFWFPRGFPEHPPMAYVTPTRTMVVKVSKHVDDRGRVYHPYLASWSETSTLVELFGNLISIFSVEPPVFSRPPGFAAAAINPTPMTPKPPHMASSSMAALPHVASMSAASLPHFGAMSMSSLPPSHSNIMATQQHPQPKPQQQQQQQSSAFVRPMSVAEADLATVTNTTTLTAVETIEQGTSQISLEPKVLGGAQSTQSANPAISAAVESPSYATYKFNPVAGRPPVPVVNPGSAPGSPATASTITAVQTSPRLSSASASAAQPAPVQNGTAAGNDKVSAAIAAAAAAAAARTQSYSDSESVSGRSKRWSIAESTHSAADSHATPESTPAPAPVPAPAPAPAPTQAPAQTQTYTQPPTRVQPAASTTSTIPAAAPKSPPPSSLLDSEPMDDPMKRLVGYQLAIYDRVSHAVNVSREKHTRVNKELLDQSANLNSGAGVIAEERKQLSDSQRQLTANISVLENKLTELNDKKEEFPDASQIADVTKVFRGQTPAMEQLFDLAGEIAAIDDTLYLLGKALNDGQLSLSIYMRQVRKLAQQQFLAKALALKIRGICNLDK